MSHTSSIGRHSGHIGRVQSGALLLLFIELHILFVGLASSGGSCTKANEPSVFEDVGMYAGWIKKTMEDAQHPYQY